MEKFIKFQSAKVRFMDDGEGFPIILLHGYLESIEIWDSFTSLLIKHFRLIRIDLLGHGKSDMVGNVSTMELMAESILEIMDYLKINKAFMLGHSLGGYVALAFLELFPDRLNGLCLFHSHPLADVPETIKKRKREINLVLEGRKDLIYNVNIPNAFASDNLDKFKKEIDFAKEIARNTPDNGIIAALNGMIERSDRSKILAETNLPFLWVLGRKDNYIPYDIIVQKVEMPANGKLITLGNSGHQGFMEEEYTSFEIIKSFLTDEIVAKSG